LTSSPSGRLYSVISSGPHFEVYVNGSLLIKNAGEDDSGLYLCQASNSIGPGLSKVITLSVHGESCVIFTLFCRWLSCLCIFCTFSSSGTKWKENKWEKDFFSLHLLPSLFDVLIHLRCVLNISW
jgi:hypothetical protein